MTSAALIFVTIGRPQVAQRLIRSARKRFPKMSVYVADQSLDVSAMEDFYKAFDVNLIRMPYDSGVCVSRNRLVASVLEPYILLCDDDFVLTESTDLSGALAVLNEHNDIGVVGGRLFDFFDDYGESVRNWELFLLFDRLNRVLTGVPITNYAPRIRKAKRCTTYLCDAVLNFAVMRRSIFDNPCIRWDERFKSNGEHEDFYLNLKSNSDVKVAYLPTMTAGHHHPKEFGKYRSRLRDRQEGWTAFFDKWGIDQYLEFGHGLRTRSQLTDVYDCDAVRRRFYLNSDLSLERSRQDPLLLVRNGNRLEATGEVSEEGSHQSAKAPNVRLTVRGHPNQLLVAYSESSHEEKASPCLNLEDALVRYGLIPANGMNELDLASVSAIFRYNPFGRPDTDFTVWYRLRDHASSNINPQDGDRFVKISVRWYDSSETCLTWAGSEAHLYTETKMCWKPIIMDVPLQPARSQYLRFEIVARQNNASKLLGVGFYCEAKQTAGPQIAGTLDVDQDVLALKAFIPRMSHVGVGRLIAWTCDGVDRPGTLRSINSILGIHSIQNLSSLKCPAILVPLSEAEMSIGILQEVTASGSERNMPGVVAVPLALEWTYPSSVDAPIFDVQ